MSQATERATMPKGTHAVLEHRTVFNANQNLLSVVKPGNHVLDVGCGSGGITAGIALLVGSTGGVTGIDTSEHLIELAKENHQSVNNIHFERADISQYVPEKRFDVVSAARVLQWVANPGEILIQMIALSEPGGYVSILDYNHKKIQWSPGIPASMQRFYKAFLQWREDAGMDNETADHLAAMFEEAGLKNIMVADYSEITNSTDKDFATHINIWAIVAATRGKQLVSDGYISEEEREDAEKDYQLWAATTAQSMAMYLLAVSGQK
ncbi:methyltransferase domain-containing protein [Ilyomonas limi]|uniref:Methyltransferase domain-containing protein n=1 Tax=Ilyomonas limi TaxID=2575867 RepID=A0A4U3L482_9BACT|nr:methyltransferase domain-containing protein [Ilyomonas limi]TKK69895.1 methyltransferase domain-containing protein [Ilyomonas limi]